MLAKLIPIKLDVLLAVVLTWLTVATTVTQAGGHAGWAAYVLTGLTVAPIALRQLTPVATTTVMLGALVAYSLLDYSGLPGAGIGVLVGMFTVATLRSRAVAALPRPGSRSWARPPTASRPSPWPPRPRPT